MKGYVYQDNRGTFQVKNPEDTSYLYFPIAGESGLKSSVTPLIGGDSKTDQNHFLLQPVSAEELHNNKSTRNFWCDIKGKGIWSATGASAEEAFNRAVDKGEKSELTAGFMWHSMKRKSGKNDLSSEIINFVPLADDCVELMMITIKNIGSKKVTFTPYGAIPIYGRSADNIRDHRHVTSLLHRVKTTEKAVIVNPTLSFDERGHQENDYFYTVAGVTGDGDCPVAFYPTVDDFIGEGGSFETPKAVYNKAEGVGEGSVICGYEAMGAMRFEEKSLKPEEKAVYILIAGADTSEDRLLEVMEAYSGERQVLQSLEETKEYWKNKVNVQYHTANADFDNFMNWVSFQPMLRRVYGCSFLPHHDYGKGGRGWRDLWQDCLALLIMNPDVVRGMLVANFGGVRMDGSNATIIGSKPGEFIADRNNITRVWMDHGVWPLMTTKFYIDQTGDIAILLNENTYFKDKQAGRGTRTDTLFESGEKPVQKDKVGNEYVGSILEHLLVQNLTSFYEVGEHNHMRLRGADWNDALDMAAERGESVAFTAAYAGNFEVLADLIERLVIENRTTCIEIAEEIKPLLQDKASLYENKGEKRKILENYGNSTLHVVSGNKELLPAVQVIESLRNKAAWLKKHIRETEWIEDGKNGWFNSYYDNHGKAVEGIKEDNVRMMLTGQVFAIMSGTAQQDQVSKIVRSADKYLYEKEVGGYKLNTDFKEVKMDLGRMFGFAYGQKENGAVFSHMTTMYANALYKRGFAKEGYKALNTLYEQAADFDKSRIYPGIPEYFDGKGRGLYHYLTGAASWYMMTVVGEMFGVKGHFGELHLEPGLLAKQFDKDGKAGIKLQFGGRNWNITYINREKKEYGEYKIGEVTLDGCKVVMNGSMALTPVQIKDVDEKLQHDIVVELI